MGSSGRSHQENVMVRKCCGLETIGLLDFDALRVMMMSLLLGGTKRLWSRDGEDTCLVQV